MIPEFGKPLPVNASNKGNLGGRWTSGADQGMFKKSSSDPESRVARLEEKAFGSTYPEHDVEARVDHLEKEIFGSKSSGSINSRLSKLEYKLGGRGAFSSSSSGVSDKNKIASQSDDSKNSVEKSNNSTLKANGDTGKSVSDRSIATVKKTRATDRI